uniref:T-cell surface glycoprotein CD3 zeta chain n=1 Tax=Ailuropoda melanoleuca TaxID=9646 RepID=G1KZH4_AILME
MNRKGECEFLGPVGRCEPSQRPHSPPLPEEAAAEQSQQTPLLFCAPAMAATASASWHQPGGKDKMTRKALVIMALLQAQLPVTGAQSFGLLDPKLCYLLDGLLFIYGLVITALFLRAKFGRSAAVPEDQQGPNQLYNELNLRGREEYEVLDKRRGLDPEMGGKQQRKRNPQEVVYNALQKDKMAEAYSEIGIKGENQRRRGKGHDGLYQGLSTATKDTYDALHMQTLPPR